MNRTLDFYEPIKQELNEVEESLFKLSDVSVDCVSPLLSHLFQVQGKKMRPAITILSSKLFPGSREEPLLMAGAVELLHLATLIHDDTVDDASTRRGRATIASLWGPQVAVLVGDYIFATSATFVCDTNNIRVIRRFSETIMELSTGELMEQFSLFDWRQTRKQYEDRIYNKTACLFSTSGESGAVLSKAPESVVQSMKNYGKYLGMAFQVIDDILDFEAAASEMGKPVGNDLVQGILTLPGMLLLERYPDDNPIVSLFEGKDEEKHLKMALDMLHNSDVIHNSYSVAEGFARQATEAISDMPESAYKRSLMEIAAYSVERQN
jgi:octaprenyl-diphosphate synthase